jgi:menaquinol-cytochrome c reductase iron-sulfur subunit
MAESSRRRFYLSFIYGLGGIMGAVMAVPAVAYLLLPPRLRKQQDFVEAGNIAQLPPKQPVEMIFRQTRTDGWKVTTEKRTAWVVNLPGEGVVAFGPQCTHLGCAYHWEAAQGQFFCPCHNSAFSVDGKVLAGPAPRPLDRYETKVDNQKLFLGELKESA